MTSPSTADHLRGPEFTAADGVEDWRVVWGGGWACAYFRTGSFAAGVAFVQAIGELAVAADHDPDVDLRPEGVSVRLFTHDPGGLSSADVALARQISAAARDVGLTADPGAVQHVQVAIDAPGRYATARPEGGYCVDRELSGCLHRFARSLNDSDRHRPESQDGCRWPNGTSTTTVRCGGTAAATDSPTRKQGSIRVRRALIVIATALQDYLRWRNANARHPDVIAAHEPASTANANTAGADPHPAPPRQRPEQANTGNLCGTSGR